MNSLVKVVDEKEGLPQLIVILITDIVSEKKNYWVSEGRRRSKDVKTFNFCCTLRLNNNLTKFYTCIYVGTFFLLNVHVSPMMYSP